ncbi:hypothetical protein SCUP234_04380 [Seiridium cupressi]
MFQSEKPELSSATALAYNSKVGNNDFDARKLWERGLYPLPEVAHVVDDLCELCPWPEAIVGSDQDGLVLQGQFEDPEIPSVTDLKMASGEITNHGLSQESLVPSLKAPPWILTSKGRLPFGSSLGISTWTPIG